MFPFCLLGFFVGGILGYLTRPSAMLVGQLPFGVVITRGVLLQGLDQVFMPVAQRSFNQVAAGAILGTAIASVVGAVLNRANAR